MEGTWEPSWIWIGDWDDINNRDVRGRFRLR